MSIDFRKIFCNFGDFMVIIEAEMAKKCCKNYNICGEIDWGEGDYAGED